MTTVCLSVSMITHGWMSVKYGGKEENGLVNRSLRLGLGLGSGLVVD